MRMLKKRYQVTTGDMARQLNALLPTLAKQAQKEHAKDKRKPLKRKRKYDIDEIESRILDEVNPSNE